MFNFDSYLKEAFDFGKVGKYMPKNNQEASQHAVNRIVKTVTQPHYNLMTMCNELEILFNEMINESEHNIPLVDSLLPYIAFYKLKDTGYEFSYINPLTNNNGGGSSFRIAIHNIQAYEPGYYPASIFKVNKHANPHVQYVENCLTKDFIDKVITDTAKYNLDMHIGIKYSDNKIALSNWRGWKIGESLQYDTLNVGKLLYKTVFNLWKSGKFDHLKHLHIEKSINTCPIVIGIQLKELVHYKELIEFLLIVFSTVKNLRVYKKYAGFEYTE